MNETRPIEVLIAELMATVRELESATATLRRERDEAIALAERYSDSVRECGVGGCKVLIDDHTVCGIHGDPPTSPRSVPQTPPDAPRGFRRARSREPGPSR